MTTNNFYDVLGIDREARESEIKTNYHKLARQYHPDKNSRHDAKEKFIAVQAAYDTLSDPGKREEYDNNLKNPSSNATSSAPTPSSSPTPSLAQTNANLKAHLKLAYQNQLNAGSKIWLNGQALHTIKQVKNKLHKAIQNRATDNLAQPDEMVRRVSETTLVEGNEDLNTMWLASSNQLASYEPNNNYTNEIIIEDPSGKTTSFKVSTDASGRNILKLWAPNEFPFDPISNQEWSSSKTESYTQMMNAGGGNTFTIRHKYLRNVHPDGKPEISLANAQGLYEALKKTNAIQDCDTPEQQNTELNRRTNILFKNVVIKDEKGEVREFNKGEWEFKKASPTPTSSLSNKDADANEESPQWTKKQDIIMNDDTSKTPLPTTLGASCGV